MYLLNIAMGSQNVILTHFSGLSHDRLFLRYEFILHSAVQQDITQKQEGYLP
jgi:hypothetical protein